MLAAGHGRRLRPLTETTPKPLLPVLGKPILLHTLERLARLGVEQVAINLHHRPEAIPAALGRRPAGLEVTYSTEPTLRGTLGALAPLRDFVAGAEALIVVNGDSLCRWPLARLLKKHRRTGAAATLLLLRGADAESFGGGVGLDEGQRVVSLRRGRSFGPIKQRRVYAGAQILDPARLPPPQEGESHFVPDLWEPWLASGQPLVSLTTRRRWHDLGTPGRFLEAALDQLPWWRRNWLAPGTAGPRRRWRRVVAESGVEWGAGTRLRDCLLFAGSSLGEGCRLEQVVVGPGTRVPPGTQVQQRLLTRPRAGISPPPGTSRLGELWVSPLVPDGSR